MWSNINIYYVRTFWIKYHNLNIINLICKSLILKSKLNIILLWNGCGSHPENSNFCQIVLRLQILECRSSSEIITSLIKKLNPATLRSDDTIDFLSMGTLRYSMFPKYLYSTYQLPVCLWYWSCKLWTGPFFYFDIVRMFTRLSIVSTSAEILEFNFTS